MNRESVNPYAVPEGIQQSQQSSANDHRFELSDDGLVCGARLHLPRICMWTGQDVGENVSPWRLCVYARRAHRVFRMVARLILLSLFFSEWYSQRMGFAWPLITSLIGQAIGFAVYAIMMQPPWGRSRVLVLAYYSRTGVWRGLMVGGLMGGCFGLIGFSAFYLSQRIGSGLFTLAPLIIALISPVVEKIVRIVMKPPYLEVRPDGMFELRGFRPEVLARLRSYAAVAGDSGVLGGAEKAGSH